MPDLFGTTRDVVNGRYALLTPGGLVPCELPGWEKAVCFVPISPALGARFSQLLITLEREGSCAGNTGVNQYFVYLLEGAASIVLEAKKHRLEPGSYAYLPSGEDVQISSHSPATRLLVFQSVYQALPGVKRPTSFAGHEREVRSHAFRGGESIRMQALLPNHPSFDLAINILTCQPGAALPVVEAPFMERGVMILRGQGIYRLEADWHPVQAGDVIWAAAYCPQWFLGMGKAPASYICYQNVNRDPM
jgi:(S)-ureidoglycine aminohydrolase